MTPDPVSVLRRQVLDVVESTPAFDIHTHLFPPVFGGLALWGVDELVTYHYLIAELFRSNPIRPEEYWALDKQRQADLIWDTLFVRNTPISEATRGVVAVFTALGLDPEARDLSEARRFFAAQDANEHFGRILDLAHVSDVVMTNDPFHPDEARTWREQAPSTHRFHAALRLDPLLNDWAGARARLAAQGYKVSPEVDAASVIAATRFLDDWIGRMRPLYAAVSLPSDFQYPDDSLRTRLLREVVIPTCHRHGLPFAMMIGVRRQVNPALRDAGDGAGRADVSAVERLCETYPANRFLVTVLSRENQHELCVAARKFSNLLPFGCWWFMNNPSIVTEITAERVEMLGASFIPQHSDARILEQLIYKWSHSRRVIASVLAGAYAELARDGWQVTRAHIERDVRRMFSGNFRSWVSMAVRPAAIPAD